MEIETSELLEKNQLYSLLQDGIDDIEAGCVNDAEKVISIIMERRENKCKNNSVRVNGIYD